MNRAWDLVEAHFKPKFVLTPLGHRFVQTYSCKAAHPEFPFAGHFLTMMASLSNGAKVRMFPNAASPLCAIALNVNYSQTRRSSIYSNACHIGKHADAVLQQAVQSKIDAACAVVHVCEKGGVEIETRDDKEVPPPQIASVVLPSSSPDILFDRCSGGFEDVINADKIKTDVIRERQWFGVLGNFDDHDARDFLLSFGLIDKDHRQCATRSSCNAHSHQLRLGAVMKYGNCNSNRLAKKNTSADKAITLGICGNILPAHYVPMETGNSDSQDEGIKELFLITTGRPIHPNEPLPEDFEVPRGCDRWVWVPILPENASMFPAAGQSSHPEEAAKSLPQCADATPASANEDNGYPATLPDNIETRVRAKKDSTSPNGYMWEYRLPNRDFELDEEVCLEAAVRRVMHYFQDPHLEIDFDPDARRCFRSLQGGYNSESYRTKDQGTRLNAASWQTGVLAALLLVFDIFCGHFSTQDMAGRQLLVTKEHVKRAASFLQVVSTLT